MRTIIVYSFSAVFLLMLVSCDKSPLSPSTETPVAVSVSFSNSLASSGLSSATVTTAADSIRIDSAVVVFKRIKFESHIDSSGVDSTDEDGDDDSDDANVKFKGPFVVHVRDPLVIDLGQHMLPAGTYDGIKFKIHRLKTGEHHEDSDELKWGHRITPDSLPVGSSIVVWGAVLKEGQWVPFEFHFNEDVEFKLRGTFVIPVSTSTVNIALNFNMPLWFKNPLTGGVLDPTDNSEFSRSLFRRAIHLAFGKGKCGRDNDGDGHPDDD